MCVSQELCLLCYTVEDIKFCEDFYLRKWGALYGKKAHGQWETVDNEYGSMGVWEYGLVKEVCLLEEEVCLWGMHSTVSIHIHGRKIYQQQQQQQQQQWW